MDGFWGAVTRRKPPNEYVREEEDEPKMSRVLNLLDLTLLGIGATLGVGFYVLSGRVALEYSGPAVVVSFSIAAIASLLSAICYADFASVVPTAGTAYTYSYVGIGEFPAFFVGWNLLLEYAIATASVSRGFSNYVDAVSGYRISNWSLEHIPLRVQYLAAYPDFLSLGFISLLAVLLALGVKESSIFNNICTCMNLLTVAFTIVVGSTKARASLWNIRREDIPAEVSPKRAGQGGFFPFGARGVMKGAALCFYAFVGFDTITACGEEARNPRRDIPLSILLTIASIFCAYFATSTVITMMVPYYDQDRHTPFTSAFDRHGMDLAKWIVTTGAMFALCTSLLGAMFPLPRVLLTMANDGLIFRYFSKIETRTETSVRSTALAYVMSGSMALLFDLEQLTDMMSIGTLMAYIIVALSVVQIRYRGRRGTEFPEQHEEGRTCSMGKIQDCFRSLSALINYRQSAEPTNLTSWIVTGAQICFVVLTVPACYMVAQVDRSTSTAELTVIGVSVTLLVATAVCIYLQPSGDTEAHFFKTPFVPWLPYTSVLINIYLMMEMGVDTWIRFLVWLCIGSILYFSYSIHQSTLALREE